MDLRPQPALIIAMTLVAWCLPAPSLIAEQPAAAEEAVITERPEDPAVRLTGLVTDTANHPMTPVTRPAPGEGFIDPEFGTRIVRITNARPGGVIKPMYSTIPAWNCDESLLLLWNRDTGHVLYDGRTYEFIKALDIDPTDLEHVIWDTSDPNIIRFPAVERIGGARRARLYRYNVVTEEAEVIHDFTADGLAGDGFGLGTDPMFTSWDSAVWGLAASEDRCFTFNARTMEIGGTAATEDAVVATPGPSGQRFYLDGVVYDFEMNRLLDLGLRIPEHASIGRLPNGHDAYFSVQYDTEPNGTLVAFDMTTGEVSVLVGPENGYPYPPAGTHISAVAYRNPSMIAVSIIGFQADGQSLLDNELLLVNTATGKVARVAHHHSLGRHGDFGYWAEPHVVISPTGTRLLFGSDWGGDSVDTYVVELPGYGE